jgi:hypothetical protein
MSECKYCNKTLIEPVHIQKGFHVSCKQKKDREEMDDAKKNIAANKAPNASFVQGGDTGLRQTRINNYPQNNHRRDNIYPGIKNTIKAKYKHIDIVFMHGLSTRYYVAEEDAELIHKLDSEKTYRQDISYFLTSIGRNEKKEFIEKLTEQNKGYVFMNMKKPLTDPVKRIIVDSSDKELIGDEEY